MKWALFIIIFFLWIFKHNYAHSYLDKSCQELIYFFEHENEYDLLKIAINYMCVLYDMYCLLLFFFIDKQ